MKYKDTKLISFLQTFSKDELDDFEKFLSQQYFRQRRDPLPLFKILMKFQSEFSNDDFNEEKVFVMLYPGTSFSSLNSKNIFRSLSSYLLKALEDFLYISKLKENKVLKNRILLKEILERNLSKHYGQYLEKAYEVLKEDEKIFGFDILEKFHIERLNSRYYASVLDMKNYFSHSFKSLELISSHFWLDLISSAKLMLLGHDNMNIRPGNDVLNKLLNSVEMDKILKIYEGTEYYIYLYFNYNVYKCIENYRDLKYYENAKKIFFDNRTKISNHDKNYFYADLISILLVGSEGRFIEMKKELFSILQNCLEEKAYKLSDNDFMHPNFYRNCILCAEYIKEFDWADDFIEKYSGELNPEFRDNMKNYSRALINYSRGDYDKSLEYISRIKYDHAFFKTDIKTLTLRIYYELNLHEQAIYMADTFRHHIKISPHLNENIRKASLNFISYYLKLFKLKMSNGKSRKKDAGLLISQIKKEKDLIQVGWLIEKLDKIETSL